MSILSNKSKGIAYTREKSQVDKPFDTWMDFTTNTLRIVNGSEEDIASIGGSSGSGSERNIYAWGNNDYGQFGDGTLISSLIPKLSISDSFTSIHCSGDSTLALKSDETIWTWGRNTNGQLGDGTTSNRSVPTQVPGISGVSKIQMSGYNNDKIYSLVLKTDGTVWFWGYNSLTASVQTAPVSITYDNASPLTDIVDISGGSNSAFALKEDGTFLAWGINDHGQVGDNTRTTRNFPIPLNLPDVVKLSSGHSHNAVLKTDGSVWIWGDGNFGAVGQGNTVDVLQPMQVSTWIDVRDVFLGFYTSFVVKTDGSVFAWGRNSNGQFGDGTKSDSHTPKYISNWVDVDKLNNSQGATSVLSHNDTVWICGSNNVGELGDGTTTESLVPKEVSTVSNVEDLAIGLRHSIALTTPP